MLFALYICVNKKTPPTHSVNWGFSSPSKTSLLLFYLNVETIQAPIFRQFTPNILVFHALLLTIGFFSELPQY